MANAAALLWHWYADTLVHYAPDSWVASTASTFRVLAFLTIVPGILLTLLDVTSYVIARTLGDPTASTSARFVPLPPSPPPESVTVDASTPALEQRAGMPTIVVGPASPTAPTDTRAATIAAAASGDAPHITVDELAGIGVFSPAASAPGSPVLARRPIALPGEGVPESTGEDTEDDATTEPEHAGEGESCEEIRDALGESYALLEREESWEDAGMQMRRRTTRASGAE